MAKEVKARVRMLIPAGAASPAPPVGQVLGRYQVAIMDFCKQFNAQTAQMKGQTIPVVVTIYADKKFDFIIKTPRTSELIMKKLNLEKGSSRPNTQKVGKLSWKDVEDIAKIKMPDLNAVDLNEAKKVIAGSARSMGIDVE
jgi:large subunit ribosomal protein L11